MNWITSIAATLIPFCLLGATHIGPSYDTKPRYAIDAFAKKLAKEYQLEFLNSGTGHMVDAKQGIWALSLVCRQPMTLDEGRQLATAIAQKLLNKVFTDPLFTQYCQKERCPLKSEYVAFRLAFWDKNTDRPQHPYLAQIRLADGNFFYHYADPITQALQPPIAEPLEIHGLGNQ
jgi:hypothetical protein